MWQPPTDQTYLSTWQGEYNGRIPLEETVSPITPSPSPGITAYQTQTESKNLNPEISSVHPVLSSDRKSPKDGDFDTYLQGYGPGFEHVQTSDQSFFATPRHHAYQRVTGFGDRLWGSRDDGSPRLVSWWWWWEIGAALVSITSMTLILVVLGKADDMPIQDWTLPIQPNSLVAVLTTLGKSAMMIVVASCISQLKWRHFQRGSRPLRDLQVFEDASRGPWGSAVFLGRNLRVGAVTAGAFAFITVVALGIEPTVQQIFDFPSRLASLENVTAEVGRAVVYGSKAYASSHGHALDISMFNRETLLFQSRIINGVLGSVAEPSYSCPATGCSWPDFSSMGMCSSFRNLTDVAKPDCTIGKNGTDGNDLECTFDYAGRNETEYLVTMKWQMYQPPKGDIAPLYFSFFQSEVTNHTDEIGGTYGSMTAVRVTDPSKFADRLGPPVEMLQSRWYLCEQTFHNLTVEAGKLSVEKVTSEPLVPVRNTSTANTGRDEDILLTYRSPSTDQEYSLPKLVPELIVGYLKTLLSNPFAVQVNLTNPTTTGNHDGSVVPGANDLFPMGYFMNLTDLANMTTNIASTLSAQMRSDSQGDNANLTIHAGQAFATETYIKVRWAWVVLPLAETVLSAVFLVATIILTRETPLFKGSVLALLVHGLRGWSEGSLRGIYRRNTAEELGRSSEGMVARFREDGEGWFGFQRAG